MKKKANVLLGLLVLQFILGMLANLYATIPHHKPYEVFHQLGFITLHAVNATLILVLATLFLVKAIKTKGPKVAAIRGLGSIIVAYVFGELFVFTQQDFFSFLMALGFIGAFLAYAQVSFTKEPQSKT